jgi:hypothetical protein
LAFALTAARLGAERFAVRADRLLDVRSVARLAFLRSDRRLALRPVRVLVARIFSALTRPLCHRRLVWFCCFLAEYSHPLR